MFFMQVTKYIIFSRNLRYINSCHSGLRHPKQPNQVIKLWLVCKTKHSKQLSVGASKLKASFLAKIPIDGLSSSLFSNETQYNLAPSSVRTCNKQAIFGA